MKYRITPKLGDGLAEAPPVEWEGDHHYDGSHHQGLTLMDVVWGEMEGDEGETFGVGFTLTVERIA